MRRTNPYQSLDLPVLQAQQRLVVDGQQVARIAQQALAVVGQALLSAMFLEQRVPHLFLQPLHLLGNGGLGAALVYGGRCKALQIGNRDQRAEQIEFKRFFHISILLKYSH